MQDPQRHEGSRSNASGRSVAVIVTPRYPPLLGGMERECELLACELGRRGYEVVVVTERLSRGAPLREETAWGRVLRIPSSPRRLLAVQLWVAAAQALLLLRHRRRAAFGVIRTMTLPALVCGLLKRLRLLPYPTLVTAETGGAEDDVVALARRPLFGVSRWLVDGHDALNGICGFNVDHLHELGFAADRISAIPNGVDTGAWASAAPPERVRRLLYLGRLDPEKGIHELLDAFARVRARAPDVTLTYAGDGPAAAALAEDARDVPGVELRGRVPYEEAGALLAAHDCLVLPSYSEGMPLSILEAAVRRRCIVATDVGDLRTLFGDTVRLVPPRDVAALAAALEATVGDPAPRADYGEVVERVSIERVADQILDRLGVRRAA